MQGACSLTWLMSDLCLKNEAYTVCRVLVPCVAYVRSLLKERGKCSVQGTCSFAWLMLDLWFSELMRSIFHSTTLCQVETSCQLVRLDNLDAVPCQLMRCIFDSKTLHFKLGQLVHFTNCEKYFSTGIMSTLLDMTEEVRFQVCCLGVALWNSLNLWEVFLLSLNICSL